MLKGGAMACQSTLNPSCYEDHGWRYIAAYGGLVLFNHNGQPTRDRDIHHISSSEYRSIINESNDYITTS